MTSNSTPSDDGANGVVSYKLARQRLIEAFRSGDRTQKEVCDAQSELRRVAHNHAAPLDEACPICEGDDMVTVTFAFGAGLPKGGRCVSELAELRRIQKSGRRATGYTVEVCRQCWWNHLRESFPIGGSTAAAF